MATNRVTVQLDAEDNLSGAIANIGGTIGSIGGQINAHLSQPIIGFGQQMLQVASGFQGAMNQVRALTGASGDEFGDLRQKALDLGRTTQYTASQVANSMAFMGATGYSTEQILASIAPTLSLASATTTDLARTADIATNIMSGYGIAAQDFGRAGNILSKAFATSNLGTDLNNLGYSFQYVGPVARAAGYEFEQTAALIANLGNSGYQGSKAGTILRGAISRLLNPTKAVRGELERLGVSVTDSNGALLPMADILDQLKAGGAGASEMMKIFGAVAGPGMLALMSTGGDALREYQAMLAESADSDFADELGAVQMQGLGGAMKGLSSAWEGLQLAIADSGIMDVATVLVSKMTTVIQGLATLNPTILKWGVVFGGILAAVGPLLVGIAAIAAVIPSVMAGFAVISAAVAGVAFAPIIAGVAAIAAGGYLIYKYWGSIKELFASIAEAFVNLPNAIGNIFASIGGMVQGWIASIRAIWQSGVAQIFSVVGAVAQGIDTYFPIIPAILNLFTAISGLFRELAIFLIQFTINGMIAFWTPVVQAIADFFAAIARFFTWYIGLWAEAIGIVGSWFAAVGAAIARFFTWYIGMWAEAIGIVGGFFAAVGAAIASFFQFLIGKWVELKNFFLSNWAGLQSAIAGFINGIANAINQVRSMIPGVGGASSAPAVAGAAANGFVPSTGVGGLLGAAMAESRQMPSGSSLLVANSSEAILNRAQQAAIAAQLGRGSRSFGGTINVYGSPGMDVQALAQQVMSEIEDKFRQYEAGYLV